MEQNGSFFIVLLRFPYLLFHYNDNKLSNKAQEKARSNTVPQRHKEECQKVWEKFVSKETEPFVQIPSGENKMTISVSGDPRKLQHGHQSNSFYKKIHYQANRWRELRKWTVNIRRKGKDGEQKNANS